MLAFCLTDVASDIPLLQGLVLLPLPWRPFSSAQPPLGEKTFPDTQPKPVLTQLHAIYSSPVTGHHTEEISASPSAFAHEDVEDHNEVSPHPPLLQAKHNK